MENKFGNGRAEHKENKHNGLHEPQNNSQEAKIQPQTVYILMFLNKISWIFAPLHPFYVLAKSYEFVNNFFSAIENIAFWLLEYVSNLVIKFTKDAREVPVQSRFQSDRSVLFDSTIKRLYNEWFGSYLCLCEVANYFANLYEEIVPLLPGDIPWDESDTEDMSIAELCFCATKNMGYRLLIHSKMFLQHVFTFFKDLH